jgi:hypothetical protein
LVKAQGNFARSPWLLKGSVGEYSRLNFESHTPEINEFTIVEIHVLLPDRGFSLSEGLILPSIKPKYDNRFLLGFT